MSYDQNDIDKFFSALHEVPENVSIKKVHQLINHPPAQARLVETNSIKPFIIMSVLTSVIIATTWFLWPAAEENESELKLERIEHFPEMKVPKRKTEIALESLPADVATTEEVQPVKHSREVAIIESQPAITPTDQQVIVEDSVEEIFSQEANLTDCGWSKDQVIPADDVVLQLTVEELSRLGFEYEESDKKRGLYYLNEHEGIVSSFLMDWKKRGSSTFRSTWAPQRSSDNDNIKKDPSHFDFYPLFMTDFTGESVRGAVIPGSAKMDQRDLYVGIKLNQQVSSLFDQEQTIWFQPTESFLALLPDRYSYLSETVKCIRELRDQTGRTNIVSHYLNSMMEGIQALELPQDKLEQMGFEFSNNQIEYSQQETALCGMTLSLGEDEMGVDMRGRHPKRLSKLVFVSDNLGRQWVSWNCDKGNKEKSNEAFVASYETLIPVILSKSTYPFLTKDQFLWFEATDELLGVIPGEQGQQIREEYEYLVAEVKSDLTTSCTFFEACRSTIHLHELEVYPNPTSDGKVSIRFQLPEQSDLSITLTDLNGKEVSQLISRKTYDSGLNELKLNVATAMPGMYLLIIRTKDGYLSRRIMIK